MKSCISKTSRGKKPTRKQKIIMRNNNLKSDNWLVVGESIATLHIKNKTSGNIRSLAKESWLSNG